MTSRRSLLDPAWRRALVPAFGFWLGSRIGYGLVAYAIATYHTGLGAGRQDALWLWDTWDGEWYVSIALRGYQEVQQTNFLPLYPGLAGLLSHILGGANPNSQAVLVSLLAVSNLCALAGLVVLARLADHEFGPSAVAPVLLVAVAAPAAFFTAAPYSEGLEFLLAVTAIYMARTARWRWAVLAAFLAALTRWTAFALVLPLAWEYARQCGWWRAPEARRVRPLLVSLGGLAAIGLAAPMALLAWMGFLGLRFGDPMLFLHVRTLYWHQHLWPIWRTLAQVFPLAWQQEASTGMLPMDVLVFGLVALSLVVLVARRAPAWMALLTVGLLLISVSAVDFGSPDLLQGATRHLVLAFPAYLLVGGVLGTTRTWLPGAVAAGSMLLQGLLLIGYLNWAPVF